MHERAIGILGGSCYDMSCKRYVRGRNYRSARYGRRALQCAQFNRAHGVALCGRQRLAMLLPVGLAVAAEHIRHFRTALLIDQRQAGGGTGSAGVELVASKVSSGLTVAHTSVVVRRKYFEVVFRLRWPSRSWMVRRSAPESSR